MNRKEREACWAARDAFHALVDASPTGAAEVAALAQLRARFEAACPAVWVRSFDKRHGEELAFAGRIAKIEQKHAQFREWEERARQAKDKSQTS